MTSCLSGRLQPHSTKVGSYKRRADNLPDYSISHMPFSQTLKGSFVECRGVWVATVNWKRQSPLEH